MNTFYYRLLRLKIEWNRMWYEHYRKKYVAYLHEEHAFLDELIQAHKENQRGER